MEYLASNHGFMSNIEQTFVVDDDDTHHTFMGLNSLDGLFNFSGLKLNTYTFYLSVTWSQSNHWKLWINTMFLEFLTEINKYRITRWLTEWVTWWDEWWQIFCCPMVRQFDHSWRSWSRTICKFITKQYSYSSVDGAYLKYLFYTPKYRIWLLLISLI